MRLRTPEQRGWWLPVALLVMSLTIAGVAVFQAQRASLAHEATAKRLIREYSAFAAWSYGLKIRDALALELRGIFQPVLQPTTGPRGNVSVADWFEERYAVYASQFKSGLDVKSPLCQDRCVPRYLFRLELQSDSLTYIGPASDSLRAIAHVVRNHALSFENPRDFRVIRVGGRSIAYTTIDRRVLYGFELDRLRYAALFMQVAGHGTLLPPSVTRGIPSDQYVQVAIEATATPAWKIPLSADEVRRSRSVLFANGKLSSKAAVSSLGGEFPGYSVRAEVIPRAEKHLLGATAPLQARTGLLTAALLLSAGLAVVSALQTKRAAELARMRSDFVASVSHELRTPLAQVQLFLETLRLGRYKTDEQRNWILDNMQRETTRLTSIVSNVLQFSRLERGVSSHARESTEIASYLQDIVDAYAPLAASRKARIDTLLEPAIHAGIEREPLRQAIINLLDNAVKYGPIGQVITATASRDEQIIRIAVADQGPGIDPSERERIWEPFRRGANAIGTAAAGSGIGLSVVRDVVQRHEGSVRVDTADGGGALFVIELPAAD